MKLPEAIRSLFLFHTGSNVGYAIAPLEALFHSVGLELGGGNIDNVHMAYASLQRGQPASIPAGARHVIAYNFLDDSAANMGRLAEYVAAHKIDLALFFDMQPISPIFSRLRRAGVRTILTYWGAPIASRSSRWKLALKRARLALADSKVDGMIFESHAMAELAMYGRGVPAYLIDVVPLGVDVELFRPADSAYVHERLGLPRERRVVVYSGHMEPRKGLHNLMEAAVELLARRRRQDVCFLICGNRNDEEARPYREIYAGLGLDAWICFGGYRSDLPLIYPGCFSGVIPSTGWDSFPRTALEMAAAGLPVVASRLQGLPEAVLDGETGMLYEPGNARALAASLERLLDSPELAAKYGRNGRARCERELNLGTQRERFLAVVRRRLKM